MTQQIQDQPEVPNHKFDTDIRHFTNSSFHRGNIDPFMWDAPHGFPLGMLGFPDWLLVQSRAGASWHASPWCLLGHILQWLGRRVSNRSQARGSQKVGTTCQQQDLTSWFSLFFSGRNGRPHSTHGREEIKRLSIPSSCKESPPGIVVAWVDLPQ